MSNLNPNQFALPGMEEHAHAGAKALTEGKGFRYEHSAEPDWFEGPPRHVLEMYTPGKHRMERVGRLSWLDSNAPNPDPDPHGFKPYAGEIQGVLTHPSHYRQGVASTLYKMAMDPQVHTGDDTLPLHSPDRTHHGLAWSRSVGGWDPEKEPEGKTRPQHPYEERKAMQPQRQPEVRGQQQLALTDARPKPPTAMMIKRRGSDG